MLDLVTSIVSFTTIMLYAVRIIATDLIMDGYRRDPTDFVNLQSVAFWDEIYMAFLGLLVFLYTIKMLFVLNFNQRVNSFITILGLARSSLISYTVLFMVLFLSYAMYGYVKLVINISIFKHLY